MNQDRWEAFFLRSLLKTRRDIDYCPFYFFFSSTRGDRSLVVSRKEYYKLRQDYISLESFLQNVEWEHLTARHHHHYLGERGVPSKAVLEILGLEVDVLAQFGGGAIYRIAYPTKHRDHLSVGTVLTKYETR